MKVHKLDVYPMVKHYLDELGMYGLFSEHLEGGGDIHAQSLCVMIVNIIMGVRPLYKVSDWLKDYADGQAEYGYEASKFNDDRLGDSLDILYKSDRQSLMAAASARAIEVFELETEKLHNDTTTVSFSGSYEGQDKDEGVQLARGYNKDGRPDAKQIVFGLNTTSDGQVPISAQWYDGNTNDCGTHQPNWDALRTMLGKSDFLYVADSKVATMENMAHIAGKGGKFISVLPANRSEVGDFHRKLMAGTDGVDWEAVHEHPDNRNKSRTVVYESCAPGVTREGYTLFWIRSSAKAAQDAARRRKRMAKIDSALKELGGKLNRYYLKTEGQIRRAVQKTLGREAGLFEVEVRECKTVRKIQVRRGRPGPDSEFREETETSYELHWSVNREAVERHSRKDGVFPLVTNQEAPDAGQALRDYKGQPALEKRFYALKSILEVAPVYLKLPHRIEAMLFLYFIALMVISLMERAIRNNMRQEGEKHLPILPQKMRTDRPTWNNIRYFFRQVFFIAVQGQDQAQKIIVKGLSKLHEKVLELLNVPLHLYDTGVKKSNWWVFEPI